MIMRGAWMDNLRPRSGKRAEDMINWVKRARSFCSKRLGEDSHGNSGDFNIHLNAGHAIRGSGHFKVHVSEMILQDLEYRSKRHTCRLL